MLADLAFERSRAVIVSELGKGGVLGFLAQYTSQRIGISEASGKVLAVYLA
jgi:uncharacterized membrane protein (Fun14 family)